MRVTVDIDKPADLKKVVKRGLKFGLDNQECELWLSSTKGFHLIVKGDWNKKESFTLRWLLGDDDVRLRIDKNKQPHLFKQVLFQKKVIIRDGVVITGAVDLLFRGRFGELKDYCRQHDYKSFFKAKRVKKKNIDSNIQNLEAYALKIL